MESNTSINNSPRVEIPAISTGDIKIENKTCAENEVQFSHVSLDESEGQKKKKQKVPRRILHFSDGTLEEYSTDEEDDTPQEPPIDPKTLKWAPWFWHYTVVCATKALAGADFCGEKIAWFLGITSPKYQYAIDEYNRLKEEERQEQEMLEREKEAERQRMAEAMAGMEGAVNTASNPGPTQFHNDSDETDDHHQQQKQNTELKQATQLKY